MEQSAITSTITVAAGRFAPGHLGELTQQVPFEMVDAVLAEAGGVQSRVRDLPSRVVVYLLLAAGLFAEVGYRQVWARLVAGLDGLTVALPTSSALSQARRRVGDKPLVALFRLLSGPPAGAARWRGLLVCAIDGTSMFVPDTTANLRVYPRQAGSHGGSGYPMLRLVAVVACGTRAVIDAVFAPISIGELGCAGRLLSCLRPGMLLLADRGFAARQMIEQFAGTGADLLIRDKDDRRLPVIRRHRDGSWLSVIGAMTVRVVDAEIVVSMNGKRHVGRYRLITTLTDQRRFPALDLVTLYHQRWEIETAYLELKSTLLGGRVLRARTPNGVNQEVYALLAAYQAVRLAMADATASQPTTSPDRASFTIALHAARDQIIHAAGVIAETTIDLVGAIGRAVLADPLPPRRTRVSPHVVKRAISKHRAKGTIDRTNYQATININILATAGLTTGPEP
ncbi:IS4 family transposase [Micromonospora sp. WMMD1082]|uniref:IS4 family transposase n=1 Tax=Micromonospora sp. WMMD1082 TaxID=3016104 RepID=UPI002417C0F6|nr:IS4 family transposase [Micromonospora sp. WMMD1082]MDG4792374.1 IS4 family transposase [Micromonospora sp. WMMD1082]MDG4793496.1 IS4 family transposase [Micromonospora sp. WMMD1082]MDG4794765.1 IS4 family transposase [Micromonospora sp. WMMD1082]MDG4798787.1 IS4 family transposase [Micromonospora sp. WMMD1082]MDG4798886.1 IS4 family transposase [Micromonospora sp. WMMD1082]